MTIENPIEWSIHQAQLAATAVATSANTLAEGTHAPLAPLPAVRLIGTNDLTAALREGFDDFVAHRTDVILLCVFYPLVGLLLGRMASGEGTLPLLFPLVAGFALLGPAAATGLYEMSRRRERGEPVTWTTAFAVIANPRFGAIVLLGLILGGIFLLWLITAQAIFVMTLGPVPPGSLSAFAHDVFLTSGGHMMILTGVAVGFLFAALVLAIGAVSFPMLIDRNVGIEVAVLSSVRAVATNPRTMALWGLIVAAALVLGSIPFLLGLVVVLPVLGHATWHLYRRLLAR